MVIESWRHIQPEQYVAEEQKALSKFFDRKVTVPTPPQELSMAMLKAGEIGWTQAEAHFLPKINLKQNSVFPGWTTKPGEWFWKRLKKGELTKDATTLEGIWVVVDGSQKPDYENGKQMYKNDPFANVI